MPARRRGPEGGRRPATPRGAAAAARAATDGRSGVGSKRVARPTGLGSGAGGDAADAAQALARLLGDALARRTSGSAPVPPDGARRAEALRLIGALSADPVAGDVFIAALGSELQARGLRLAPQDAMPTPETAPLVAALAAALDDLDPDGAGDTEQAVQRLDDALRDLLGASPRESSRQALDMRMRTRIAAQVAASMRRNRLVPAEDAGSAGGDPFWDRVEAARRDPAGFARELETLPEQALADFHWAHLASMLELQRAWRGDGAAPPAEGSAAGTARAAAFVAAGYEAHAQAVADPLQSAAGPAPPPCDLGAETVRMFRQRFGRDPG